MIALAYAIPLGVFAGWSGVLDLILTPVHVSQVSIMYLHVVGMSVHLTYKYWLHVLGFSFKDFVKHFPLENSYGTVKNLI